MIYPEIEKQTAFIDYGKSKVFSIKLQSYVRLQDEKGTFEIIVRRDKEIPVIKTNNFNTQDVDNLTNSVIKAVNEFHKEVYLIKHFYKRVEDQPNMQIRQKDLNNVSEKERLLKNYYKNEI